jgi:hypothetical protein
LFHTFVVTEVLKWFMAMPRPHFFSTCQPSFDELDCSAKSSVYFTVHPIDSLHVHTSRKNTVHTNIC